MQFKTMKSLILTCIFVLASLFLANPGYAIENPADKPNNKFGIHILFVDEINEAAKLINSNEGEWGYAIIPIQYGDKDLVKWQKFMDQAKQFKIIPIIRLASEGDYFNTKVWRKPTSSDILDFANFLNSLEWPVKNRYIVVFNEVNRGDEWGGSPNPSEYADLLVYATTVFKARNPDFFIISAGLDNAAANVAGVSMDQYDFLRQMHNFDFSVFNIIDGLGSHSYPNPGFSQPPTRLTSQSISSFRFEKDLVKTLSGKDLPVFITETGWSRDRLAGETIADYLKTAFNTVWNDESVIAVTPFLLRANAGPFLNFSFLNTDGSPNEIYKSLESMPKIKGAPTVMESKKNSRVLGTEVTEEVKDLSKNQPLNLISNIQSSVKILFKWLLKM